MKTNRDYLSWSQYNLWKSSKLQFYKRYVLGESGPTLSAWQKGKEFADYMETGEIPTFVTDPLLQQVGDNTPRLDIMEHELKTQIGEYKLLSYLDTCELDLTEFYEYKTGKNEWNQTLVDKHEQLDFYALCIYIKSGETIIPKCKLYWIETEDIEMTDGSKEIRYTGCVEEFTKEFTEDDMVNMMTKIVSVLNEIELYEHVEAELDETLVERYIKLLADKKELDSEINLIKLEVKTFLTNNDVSYGVSSKGRFSISKRKTFSFSSDLETKAKEYKAEIDKLKKKEKDDGIAKISYTESLLFNIVK
jgi:hypothetical protein